MPKACIELEGRTVLTLTGDDRKTFLQGLITNDVNHITPERWLYAGLLTPQGKYLYDFFITEVADTVYLDCADAHCDTLTRKLMMYRLRSKVDIAKSDRRIFAHIDDSRDTWADPRLAQMGSRRFDGEANASMDDYHAHRLSLGVPDGPVDFVQDKTLWLETNADLLNGVDFQKGCYVGQEITARMRYRGKVRRRLIPFRSDSAAFPVHVPIELGPREIGDTRSGQGHIGLANVRVEDLRKAPFIAGGVEIAPWLPDWLEAVAPAQDQEDAGGAQKEPV